MRTFRSLLWVGSGRGLSQSGLTEAPELDITWVPNPREAERLPDLRFDAVFLELDGNHCFDQPLPRLERFAPCQSWLVSIPSPAEKHSKTLLESGIGGVLVIDESRSGAGIVTEVNEALDTLAQAGDEASVTPLQSSEEPPVETSIAEPREAAAPVVHSAAMREVYELIGVAASSPSTVLITGETGVGKEVVARELHARGTGDQTPFVAVNCAAFPESLLESELFGHAKGAFTGADRAKQGLFEAAGNGTLFLDEIAETALPLQAKLLRVLQEREVRPVGDHRPRHVNCRIIAATNRILGEEVALGRFREDLFYRLNVFPIRVPALRERRGDILPLARRFLIQHGPREGKEDCHFSLASSQLLEAYHWPGNVRELENEILRALMLTPSGQLISPRQLSPKLSEIIEPIAQGARPDETLREALERIEAWLLRRALSNNHGRKAATARKLGLTREGLYKKLKRLGIE